MDGWEWWLLIYILVGTITARAYYKACSWASMESRITGTVLLFLFWPPLLVWLMLDTND